MLKQSGPTKPLKVVALHYQLSKQRKKYVIIIIIIIMFRKD